MTATPVPPSPVHTRTSNLAQLAYLLYRGAVVHRVWIDYSSVAIFDYSTPSHKEGVQWRHAYRDPDSTAHPYTLLKMRDRIANYINLARSAPGKVYEPTHEGRDHSTQPRTDNRSTPEAQ